MNGQTPEVALADFFNAHPSQRIGVAVSGGGDSLALLYLLADWAKTQSVDIFVATVDHGLRPEAEQEAKDVAAHCAQLGVTHETLVWRDWDHQGNLQAQARAARYRLLGAWGQRHQLDVILLGHTQDDQAETFLLRLARRAGVDGLSSMKAFFQRDGQTFGRPLLSVTRHALRVILTQKAIRWIDDPSNEDPQFDRVRARQALQHLETLGIDTASLADVSRNMKDARDALDAQVRSVAAAQIQIDRGDLVMPVTLFSAQPAEIQRRLLVAGLIWVSGAEYAPRRDAVSRLLQDICAGIGGTLSGCLLTVVKGQVRITREWSAVSDLFSPLPVWDRWQLTGPWQAGMQIRTLGEDGLRSLEDWRASGMPRASLLASPSVWYDNVLIAAPVAGFGAGWTANLLPERANFLSVVQ